MSLQGSMDFQVWMVWMACQAQKGLLEHQVKEMYGQSVLAGNMH